MRSVLLENTGLKILSVALALLLWFTVTGRRRERISERGYSVPITVVNIPPQTVIASTLPASVEIRVRATFSALRKLDPSKIDAAVDLAEMRPGETSHRLTAEDVNVPEGVEVVSISPAVVRLRLERVTQRDVEILPRLSGKPAPGVVLLGAIVEPKWARLVGPDSVLTRIRSVQTAPVAIDGRNRSFTATATVSSDAAGARLIEPHVVTVRVRLEPAS